MRIVGWHNCKENLNLRGGVDCQSIWELETDCQSKWKVIDLHKCVDVSLRLLQFALNCLF